MLKLKRQYFGHLMRRIWPIGKDPDAGKDWKQEERGMTEDEMTGWHHWLNGPEFEQTLGDSKGWGSLMCCSSWGHKSQTQLSDWTTRCTLKISKNRNVQRIENGRPHTLPVSASRGNLFSFYTYSEMELHDGCSSVICSFSFFSWQNALGIFPC